MINQPLAPTNVAISLFFSEYIRVFVCGSCCFRHCVLIDWWMIQQGMTIKSPRLWLNEMIEYVKNYGQHVVASVSECIFSYIGFFFSKTPPRCARWFWFCSATEITVNFECILHAWIVQQSANWMLINSDILSFVSVL